MSYGTGRDRKKRLKNLKTIDNTNVEDFLRLAADEFGSNYAELVNDRASDNETVIDRDFLRGVATKNFTQAYDAFKRDVSTRNLPNLLSDVVRERTGIDYENIPDAVKTFFEGSRARDFFMDSARAAVQRILQAPIQMGLSRTVIQKYLQ